MLRDDTTGAPFAQYGSSVFLSNDANALAVGKIFCLLIVVIVNMLVLIV